MSVRLTSQIIQLSHLQTEGLLLFNPFLYGSNCFLSITVSSFSFSFLLPQYSFWDDATKNVVFKTTANLTYKQCKNQIFPSFLFLVLYTCWQMSGLRWHFKKGSSFPFLSTHILGPIHSSVLPCDFYYKYMHHCIYQNWISPAILLPISEGILWFFFPQVQDAFLMSLHQPIQSIRSLYN